ncbi:MAG: hypothetical protein JXA28_02325, partial [Bacteroidetes bacterium]|nr:hypothetical protein [Bacteroidota bacterium]
MFASERFFLFIMLLFLSASASAQQEQPGSLFPPPGEVPLPRLPLHNAAAVPDPRIEIPEGMTVFVHPLSGSIHRAFGTALRIPGFDRITAENIHDAAAEFLRSYRSSIGVPPDQLKLQRVTHVRGRWYVTWRQQYEGMDVLLSEVELRLFDNGNVTAFGASVYPGIHVEETGRSAAADVWESAVAGLDVDPPVTKRAARPVSVLPFAAKNEVTYRPVREVPFTDRGGRSWISYVDAVTGDLLWRRETSFDIGTGVEVHGSVIRVHPNEPVLTDAAFRDMYVRVGDRTYTTDTTGRLDFDLETIQPVLAQFEGPWCKVELTDRTEGSVLGLVQPGETLDIAWADSNSHTVERILFYHTNLNRAYLGSIDPGFTALDFQTLVTVEFDGFMPNAMSDGDEIRFFGAGNESMRLASAPMVLYHELGHSVNIKLYQQLGVEWGMQNRACQEGTADLHAAMITDHPGIGTGVFVANEKQLMRNLVNDVVYPDSVVGEEHHDGQVLSGAFWDIRTSVSLDVARRLSHFAKYGLPDDPDNGIAFMEWLLETLIADDDDGDLSNGTPHHMAILAAFQRHNIGPTMFMQMNMQHVPLEDTRDTLQPYVVRFAIETLDLTGCGAEDAKVVYTLNGDGTEYSVDASPVGNGHMEACIPAQPTGTSVSYHVTAKDSFSGETVHFTSNLRTGEPWRFLVGYTPFFEDPFEADLGWTVGGTGDDATRGNWMRGNPEGADFRDFGGQYLQPEDDHTISGDQCYVTGATGGASVYEFMPDGQTTVTSPLLDLRQTVHPLLRLYYFLGISVNALAENPEPAILRIGVSDNDGRTWRIIFETMEEALDWTKVTIPLEP